VKKIRKTGSNVRSPPTKLTIGEINGEKGYAHAPVGLQVVGGRWDDENVVEALYRIEKAMGRY